MFVLEQSVPFKMSGNTKKILIPRPDHDPRMLEQFQGKGYDLEIYPGPGNCPMEEFLRRLKGKDAVLVVHNCDVID